MCNLIEHILPNGGICVIGLGIFGVRCNIKKESSKVTRLQTKTKNIYDITYSNKKT